VKLQEMIVDKKRRLTEKGVQSSGEAEKKTKRRREDRLKDRECPSVKGARVYSPEMCINTRGQDRGDRGRSEGT